jgi:TonB family protein
MSLELGQIPFRPDHTPYRSHEEQRRRRKRDRLAAKALAGVPATTTRRTVPPAGAEDDTLSALGQLSIMPDTLAPKDVAFLLGATRDRMGRSVAAAAGSHVVGVALIVLLISLAPERVYEVIEPNRENYGIVWLPEEGPGGGGGGGGNQSLEVPRPVELEGPDETELSVPVEPEPDYIEPEVEPETEVSERLNIPAVTMAAALQTLPGVMDHIQAARDSLSQGAGTGGGGGTGTGTGIGPGDGPGLGPGEGGGVGGGVYRPGSGVETPRPLRMVDPDYTSEAMRAQVQGEVWLEVVVLPDGTVGEVTITKSLDRVFGLDEEAVKAARQWRWIPGTRFGEPVPVRVPIAIEFHLR